MSLNVYAELPEGMTVLRRYRAGYSLVECSHPERTGMRCPTCGGTSDRPEKRLAVVPEARDEQLALT